MNQQNIISAYEQFKTIKETSRQLNASEQVIRRVLISNGLLITPTSKMISNYLNKGFTVDDIIKITKLSSSAVNSYLPYSKGAYFSDTPTKNALRIRKSRNKHHL